MPVLPVIVKFSYDVVAEEIEVSLLFIESPKADSAENKLNPQVVTDSAIRNNWYSRRTTYNSRVFLFPGAKICIRSRLY
jgi:hypothetical protein